jgi:hypothetical protein
LASSRVFSTSLGLEEVHPEPEAAEQLSEHLELLGGVVPGVPHGLAHHRPVLPLDEALFMVEVEPE